LFTRKTGLPCAPGMIPNGQIQQKWMWVGSVAVAFLEEVHVVGSPQPPEQRHFSSRVPSKTSRIARTPAAPDRLTTDVGDVHVFARTEAIILIKHLPFVPSSTSKNFEWNDDC
jgi:hypothetical protein